MSNHCSKSRRCASSELYLRRIKMIRLVLRLHLPSLVLLAAITAIVMPHSWPAGKQKQSSERRRDY